jgi:hypothetical protein
MARHFANPFEDKPPADWAPDVDALVASAIACGDAMLREAFASGAVVGGESCASMCCVAGPRQAVGSLAVVAVTMLVKDAHTRSSTAAHQASQHAIVTPTLSS